MKNYILITFLLFSFNLVAVVTVGSSPGFGTCTYTTIQTAIDSGEAEIRVLNNQDFSENLNINRSVIIKGGYNSCLSAQVDSVGENKTVIRGNNVIGAPVIKINTGLTTLPIVNLYRLQLSDAVDTAFSDGGRGINIGNSNVFLQIIDSLISNNSAEKGAGIYVDDPDDVTVYLTNSIVNGNTASIQGGGMYCANSNTNFIIEGSSLIKENTAFDGGGLFATFSCNVTISAGAHILINGAEAGIMNNIANNAGGGLYVDLGASIKFYGNRYGTGGLLGDPSVPVVLANNHANQKGGGIYADRNATITIEDGLIINNKAENNISGKGGAFYVDNGAELTIKKAPYAECWNVNNHCSSISHNWTDFRGGAVYALRGAKINIDNSRINANVAESGSFAYMQDLTTQAQLKNNFIFENGNSFASNNNKAVIDLSDSATVEIYHNTIANNYIANNNAAISILTSSSLMIKNSIVYNDNNPVLIKDPNSAIDAECVVVNEPLTLLGTVIIDGQPDLIDDVITGYHLGGNSEAIDLCANLDAQIIGLSTDIDGDIRPFDDLSVSNGLGTADAGADESYFNNDVIFNNDFE